MENRRWLAERFAALGVDGERLQFSGGAPHYRYLQYYDRIDFALDAFPYNGGTTTMEAIWQGVPVLTFDGDRWASRTSQTLLRRTHLGDFVYETSEAMVDAAIQMAGDPETPGNLQRLRRTMRQELERAPVCDAASLAGAMKHLVFAFSSPTSRCTDLRPQNVRGSVQEDHPPIARALTAASISSRIAGSSMVAGIL